MSTWRITDDGQMVGATYVARPLDTDPEVKELGQGSRALRQDLESWVCDQAEPYDLIHTPDGTFMRARAVCRGMLATA